MKFPMFLVLVSLSIGACATPEVAEDYKAKSYVPEEMAAALGGEDPARRADAAKQVEEMAPSDRLAALLELSRDDRAPVRLLAVGLIGRYHAGDAAAVASLGDVLSLDPDMDVRSAAVGALARSTTRESVEALLSALTDDTALNVRRAAAAALDRLSGRDYGAEVAAGFDEAEMAADEAGMAYEEWFDANGASLPAASGGAGR